MLDLAIRGPIEPADLPGLYARVCALLAGASPQLVRCEVSSVAPDAVAVDALARLALAARRHGCQLQLRGASPELRALVAFMGLSETLGADPMRPDAPATRTAGTGSPLPRRR